MGDLGNETVVAEAVIEISLGRLQQLFNSFDPSQFPDRDLDHDAEEGGLRKLQFPGRSD
jgi:hypothetical protein